MCQELVSRQCNPSENCHVPKVAHLLARPLNCRHFDFGGPANFSLVKVNSNAAFQAGTFHADAIFVDASFGGTLWCASVH
jgi:hypothetical protein